MTIITRIKNQRFLGTDLEHHRHQHGVHCFKCFNDNPKAHLVATAAERTTRTRRRKTAKK